MDTLHSASCVSPPSPGASKASSDADDAPRVPLAWVETESFTFGDFKQVVRVPLYRNQTITIGRDTKKSNLRFKNAAVSSVHCEIYSVLFDRNEQYPPLIYVRDCQSASGTYVNGERTGEGPFVTAGRLLANNDMISFGLCTLHLRDYVVPATEPMLTASQRQEALLFSDQYTITDTVIGHGAYADVYLAVETSTNRQVVCKVHDLALLRRLDKAAVRRVDREMTIWSQLDHPNIAAFCRAFRTDNTMYTFAELAAGGDLFSMIDRNQSIPELEMKWIVIQVVRAVDYLHCKGVAHRDIKPENILCSASLHMQHRVVLADFGCAGVTSLGRMTSNVGTNPYQAPEVQSSNKSHGVAVDIWAIGILALQLLIGNEAIEMPAVFHDTSQVEELVWSVNASRAGKEHGPISLSGVDFILACLHLNPAMRPTAARAAKHPWFTGHDNERVIFKVRERQFFWKPRDIIIPAVMDLRGHYPVEDLRVVDAPTIHTPAPSQHEPEDHVFNKEQSSNGVNVPKASTEDNSTVPPVATTSPILIRKPILDRCSTTLAIDANFSDEMLTTTRYRELSAP